MSYGDVGGVANIGAIQGGFGWRVSRTPHRTDLFLDLRVPPDVEMAAARRKALEFARTLDDVEAGGEVAAAAEAGIADRVGVAEQNLAVRGPDEGQLRPRTARPRAGRRAGGAATTG